MTEAGPVYTYEDKFKMYTYKVENKYQRLIDIMKTKFLKKINELNQKINDQNQKINLVIERNTIKPSTIDTLLLPIILLVAVVCLLIYIIYQNLKSQHTSQPSYNIPHTSYNISPASYNTYTPQYY